MSKAQRSETCVSHHQRKLCDQLNHHDSPVRQGRVCAEAVAYANNPSPKVRYVTWISPGFAAVIRVWRSTAKIIAVLRGHLQPCCEALTLRHAWLSLISVHASNERERERERQKEGGREGAADPGRQRRKRRHVLNMCPACTYTGSPAQSCRTRGKKRRKGTQAGRQKGGGGGEEGRRERAEKPRTPKEKRPQRTNPRRSPTKIKTKTLYPDNKA